MIINFSFVLFIFIGYCYLSEGLESFKTITNFLHPTKPSTTLLSVLPTYKVITGSWRDVDHTTAKTYPGGVSDTSRRPVKDNNFQKEIGHGQPRKNLGCLSNTQSQRPFLSNNKKESTYSVVELTDVPVSITNIDNYITQTNRPSSESDKKHIVDTTIARPDHKVSSYESTTTSYVYNNNGETTSQTQPANNSEEEPIDSIYNQQQTTYPSRYKPTTPIHGGGHPYTTPHSKNVNKELHSITCDGKNTSCNNNKAIDQNNQIQPTNGDKQFGQDKDTTAHYEEGGTIVFPTESEREVSSVERQYQNDVTKMHKYSTATTVRTPKSRVPVPVDSGRHIFDTPDKNCPIGQKLQDGVCRENARK